MRAEAVMCWNTGLPNSVKSNQIKFIKQQRAWRSYKLLKHSTGIKPTSVTCIHC